MKGSQLRVKIGHPSNKDPVALTREGSYILGRPNATYAIAVTDVPHHELTDSELRDIGRIIGYNATVSKDHLRLELGEKGLRLRDLESTTGTTYTVDGEDHSIQDVTLLPGKHWIGIGPEVGVYFTVEPVESNYENASSPKRSLGLLRSLVSLVGL